MCELATIATIASIGFSVVGGIQQQQIYNQNAAIAEQEAKQQRQVTQVREMQARERVRHATAIQRSRLGAAGVSLTGAGADILGRDAAEQGFLEAQGVRTQGESRARALDAEARQSRAQGRLALLGGFASGATIAANRSETLWPGLGGS